MRYLPDSRWEKVRGQNLDLGDDRPASTAKKQGVTPLKYRERRRCPPFLLAPPTAFPTTPPTLAGEGECGRNPLAGVRLLPPAGCAVVGALLRCGGNQIIKLRASPAKATMELPFAQNYAASTSELLLSPHRLTAVY
jgi:hypothetical protein